MSIRRETPFGFIGKDKGHEKAVDMNPKIRKPGDPDPKGLYVPESVSELHAELTPLQPSKKSLDPADSSPSSPSRESQQISQPEQLEPIVPAAKDESQLKDGQNLTLPTSLGKTKPPAKT